MVCHFSDEAVPFWDTTCTMSKRTALPKPATKARPDVKARIAQIAGTVPYHHKHVPPRGLIEPGLPEGFSWQDSNGFGFLLVRSLVSQIHGSMRVGTGEESGARFDIQFPTADKMAP